MAFASARLQRRVWDRRAESWEHEGAVGLRQVVDAVVGAAEPEPGLTAVDLGCGSGQVALRLARRGMKVTAVDVSPEMIHRLQVNVHDEQIEGVVGVVAPIERFRVAEESVDLVVSNYALHHLRDPDKQDLVRAVRRWLRPGGRIVIGDMMFGRGMAPRDRAIIRSKVVALARRGPGGWWRVLKNVARFSLRLQERPVTLERWRQYLEEAGFSAVRSHEVVAEAAVIVGTKG
jgi:ubiquinone/menaquinone biosynthesis C-methylase UbiE